MRKGLTLLAVGLLFGCGGDGGTEPTTSPLPVGAAYGWYRPTGDTHVYVSWPAAAGARPGCAEYGSGRIVITGASTFSEFTRYATPVGVTPFSMYEETVAGTFSFVGGRVVLARPDGQSDTASFGTQTLNGRTYDVLTMDRRFPTRGQCAAGAPNYMIYTKEGAN